MVRTRRTARKSTGRQPTGQLALRDVPPHSRNHSLTHLRRRNHLRLWSQYQQGNTRKKLNRCRRTMTMTSKRKKTMRKKKKVATRLTMKKMKTTLLGATPRRMRHSTTPTRSKLLEMKPRSPLVDCGIC
jgi:hypothetical protein